MTVGCDGLGSGARDYSIKVSVHTFVETEG